MKHRSIFQDDVKYIHNEILKPFRLIIIHYAEYISKIHGLAKYLPPLLDKGDEYDHADWVVCDK